MKTPTIELSRLSKAGIGLQRPEDVVVGADGRVWASDQSSACAEILADGSLRRVGRAGGDPNGINMDRQGRIIIANFASGLLQRLDPDSGEVETLADEVDGRPLTSSNYPIVDKHDRIWCSNSTDASPWALALDGRKDGFLYRLDPDGSSHILAEDIAFANGLALDADESHIYVCQTSACSVLRYAIRPDGSLGNAEPYGPELGRRAPLGTSSDATPDAEVLASLGLTDGCGFDAEGNLWVTLVAANKIVAISPGGGVVTVVEDPGGTLINHPTNVSWGGADMCDLYIGSIATNYVLHTRSPIPGLPLAHQR